MPEHTIGSISSATMRAEDLIPVFMDELETLNKETFDTLKKEYQDLLTYLEDNEDIPEELSEDASWLLNEELFDELNNCCMPYFYFGAHEGDGSDYGFWFDHESFETACQDEEILKLSDLSDLDDYSTKDLADYDYIAVVNDHGNVTLYTPKIKLDEIWAVV